MYVKTQKKIIVMLYCEFVVKLFEGKKKEAADLGKYKSLKRLIPVAVSKELAHPQNTACKWTRNPESEHSEGARRQTAMAVDTIWTCRTADTL